MSNTKTTDLADRLESALTIDASLARDALAAIGEIKGGDGVALDAADLESTDRILALVLQELPGWTVSIKGKAWSPNGHWTCSLRKTSSRDSDEYIGVGRGPTLPHSLLAALLRVVGRRR